MDKKNIRKNIMKKIKIKLIKNIKNNMKKIKKTFQKNKNNIMKIINVHMKYVNMIV